MACLCGCFFELYDFHYKGFTCSVSWLDPGNTSLIVLPLRSSSERCGYVTIKSKLSKLFSFNSMKANKTYNKNSLFSFINSLKLPQLFPLNQTFY